MKTTDSVMRQKLYQIVDSFLVEAKDQNGRERSLDRLNMDRHLAVDNLEALYSHSLAEARREERERIWEWAVNNGITHKKSFIALRDLLKGDNPEEAKV